MQKSANRDGSNWSRKNKVPLGSSRVSRAKLFPIIQRSPRQPDNVCSPWGEAFSICNVLWLSFPLKRPSISALNPIESEGAIKIPSCHKKPLRRVDAGRLLANMKRSPAPHCFSVCARLSASLERVRQKNCPTEQEVLNFYCLHFHRGSHLSGIRGAFTNLEGEIWKVTQAVVSREQW